MTNEKGKTENKSLMSIDEIININNKDRDPRELIFNKENIKEKNENNYYLENILMKNYSRENYNIKMEFYVFIPSGVTIKKVPGYILGENVLGRAFPGLRIIEILETLEGNLYKVVLDHETDHIKYPWLSEYEVRKRTIQKFPDVIN